MAAGALALCCLNGLVALVGRSVVFPLSPFFLREKVHALAAYARHRPTCLLSGHSELGPLVAEAERRHRLPPGLLAALVEVESEGRVHRISAAGAMGPGQLMPRTAAELGVTDPFAPEVAVDASARYLARQLARFRRVELALAAYNAGAGAVLAAAEGPAVGTVPRNGETELYVAKVLRAWRARVPARPERPPAVRPTTVRPSTARTAAQ